MKCLATNYAGLSARYIVDLYARRFTIEENFRDTKDIRFGFGLSSTHISTPERRDRLLLVGALGQALVTLLGAAGESLGMDACSRPTPSSTERIPCSAKGSITTGPFRHA